MTTQPPAVHLYCPAGMRYDCWNEVRAYLGGVNVSRPLGELWVAYHRAAGLGEDPPVIGYSGPVLFVLGGELFTLGDLADVIGDVLKLPTEVHDGEGYPNE